MTDIIKPPHAISLWVTKDILYAELPHADGVKGHAQTLRLPNNVWGLTKLLDILRERHSGSKLASKGDPTQGQADRDIQDMQRKAAGYTGPIKKQIKVPLTTELKNNVRDVIRRFISA